MDVLTCAWRASGAPQCRTALKVGRCARCSAITDVAPLRAAVSKSFTGFDRWADPSGAGLCTCCAWGYTTRSLRTQAHLISRDPNRMEALTRTEAGRFLGSGALLAEHCLVVPLRPGRKHLLPDAAWGRVCVDDAHLPWSRVDADRLLVVEQLRELGMGTRMLTQPAPPFPVVRRLAREQRTQVMRMWAQLAPWRTPDSPWLPLALHVTTPVKEAA